MMEDFENALINLINETPLPFEAKRYVVLKVVRDVEDAYQAEKKRRLAERESGNDDRGSDKAD